VKRRWRFFCSASVQTVLHLSYNSRQLIVSKQVTWIRVQHATASDDQTVEILKSWIERGNESVPKTIINDTLNFFS